MLMHDAMNMVNKEHIESTLQLYVGSILAISNVQKDCARHFCLELVLLSPLGFLLHVIQC